MVILPAVAFGSIVALGEGPQTGSQLRGSTGSFGLLRDGQSNKTTVSQRPVLTLQAHHTPEKAYSLREISLFYFPSGKLKFGTIDDYSHMGIMRA
jgi:hypothetical protein